MNDQPFEHSAAPDEQLEVRLRDAATHFSYPPTPDVVQAVRVHIERDSLNTAHPIQSRRWLLAITIAVLISMCALAVPQVRAAVVNLLRLGGVIIVPESPTDTPTVLPSQAATPGARPQPSATAIHSLLDLAGETTLADAQKQVSFPIRLPSYPPGLQAPDKVYLQELNGSVVVLIWLDPTQADGIRFTLQILGPGVLVYKMQPHIIQETTVNGQPALWTEGPYMLQWQDNGQTNWDIRHIVNGDVLIWTDAQLTYRLESTLTLAQALSIANSIPPVNPSVSPSAHP